VGTVHDCAPASSNASSHKTLYCTTATPNPAILLFSGSLTMAARSDGPNDNMNTFVTLRLSYISAIIFSNSAVLSRCRKLLSNDHTVPQHDIPPNFSSLQHPSPPFYARVARAAAEPNMLAHGFCTLSPLHPLIGIAPAMSIHVRPPNLRDLSDDSKRTTSSSNASALFSCDSQDKNVPIF